MKIEIPTAQWGRGRSGGYFLQTDPETGTCTRCAMGFILSALGFTDDQLRNVSCFSDLDPHDVKAKVPAPFIDVDPDDDTWVGSSELAIRVTDANDDSFYSEAQRRSRLKLFLEPAGFDLVFIDEETHAAHE